jgi:transcriptional regulator NrdR family protein
MNIKIKKASGVVEDFDSSKLLNSLIRSGADRDKAEEIISKVLPEKGNDASRPHRISF